MRTTLRRAKADYDKHVINSAPLHCWGFFVWPNIIAMNVYSLIVLIIVSLLIVGTLSIFQYFGYGNLESWEEITLFALTLIVETFLVVTLRDKIIRWILKGRK